MYIARICTVCLPHQVYVVRRKNELYCRSCWRVLNCTRNPITKTVTVSRRMSSALKKAEAYVQLWQHPRLMLQLGAPNMHDVAAAWRHRHQEGGGTV